MDPGPTPGTLVGELASGIREGADGTRENWTRVRTLPREEQKELPRGSEKSGKGEKKRREGK